MKKSPHEDFRRFFKSYHLWSKHCDFTHHPSSEFCIAVQLLSHVKLFATPWTAARQAPLSFTVSRSLLKFMSIESVIHVHRVRYITILSSAPLFSFCFQSFPTSGSFPMSWLFILGSQRIGNSASSVLPMNIQGWFPLGLTGLISLLSKGLSRGLLQHHSLFDAQLSYGLPW